MTEAELIAAFHGYIAAIVLTLFSAVCGFLITRLSFLRNDFESLYSFIIQQKASGGVELSWFGTNPEWGLHVLTYLIYVVTVGGYLASIAFFFLLRHAESAAGRLYEAENTGGIKGG